MRTIIVAFLAGLVPVAGQAAVLTVGPSGSYADIQTAVDEAILMGGDDEIRVQSGLFTENLQVYPGGTGDSLVITGGWNSAFSARTGTTTVDGNGAGKVVDVYLEGADTLRLEGFDLVNGMDNDNAGIDSYLIDSAVFELVGNRVADNVAVEERASGGGVNVSLSNTASALIHDNTIENNSVESTGTVDARSGGLVASANDATTFTITANRVLNNSVSVAGGGDTVSALNAAGVANAFSYVSTAGGAFLEWLEGKTLPGVAVLRAQ